MSENKRRTSSPGRLMLFGIAGGSVAGAVFGIFYAGSLAARWASGGVDGTWGFFVAGIIVGGGIGLIIGFLAGLAAMIAGLLATRVRENPRGIIVAIVATFVAAMFCIFFNGLDSEPLLQPWSFQINIEVLGCLATFGCWYWVARGCPWQLLRRRPRASA